MKPFNLELAKLGHPVYTRDGQPVRIICFDKKDADPRFCIIGLVNNQGYEMVVHYDANGRKLPDSNTESYLDLFMVSTNKEGWINIYPKDSYMYAAIPSFRIYNTKEDAIAARTSECLDTIKIEWEE